MEGIPAETTMSRVDKQRMQWKHEWFCSSVRDSSTSLQKRSLMETQEGGGPWHPPVPCPEPSNLSW